MTKEELEKLVTGKENIDMTQDEAKELSEKIVESMNPEQLWQFLLIVLLFGLMKPTDETQKQIDAIKE